MDQPLFSRPAIEIKRRSAFKDPAADRALMQNWVQRVAAHTGRQYESIEVNTSLGKTQVYALNTGAESAQNLVIWPGARTSVLFWDLDRGLDALLPYCRIYLVETNGLPNLSDGATPDIKGPGYGFWAAELLDALGIQKTWIAGASFGGQICMKLAIQAPARIQGAFLLNPGCLQPFSLSFKNLYYNLLPIFSPQEKHVRAFLDAAVFCKPQHQLSAEAEQLLVDYEVLALTRYRDRTQKPCFMGDELKQVQADTYLLEGDQDLLFPYQKSIANARALIQPLREVEIFKNVGHGIETYAPAIQKIADHISGKNQAI